MEQTELFSIEEERIILGHALHDPSIIDSLALQPDDFWLDRHKWVWQALTKLITEGKSIDFLLVGEELKAVNRLDDIGGMVYLSGLLTETFVGDIQAHSGIIKMYSRRRDIKAAAEQLLSIAHGADVKALESGTAQVAEKLLSGSHISRQSRHWGKVLADTLEKVEERAKDPREVWGIMSGLNDLDAYTGGAMYGKMTTIIGASGIGKSILSYQLGISHLMQQVPGAPTTKGLGIYTLEMDAADVAYRSLSAMAQVPTLRLLSGFVRDEDWPPLVYALERGDSLPVYINDSPGLSIYEFEADLRRLKYLYGVDSAVVDYMYILEASVPKGEDRIEYLSRNLRRITRQLGVIMYVVNSTIKDGGEDEVNLKDMRGSGQAGNEADNVWAILKHQPENNGMKYQDYRTIKPLKGRHMPGAKPLIHVKLNPDYPWFENAKATHTKL